VFRLHCHFALPTEPIDWAFRGYAAIGVQPGRRLLAGAAPKQPLSKPLFADIPARGADRAQSRRGCDVDPVPHQLLSNRTPLKTGGVWAFEMIHCPW
jgi:hypothetical protein